MTPIIQIKGLGKRYDITHQRGGYIALRDVLVNVFKRPFSFLKSKAKRVVGLEKKEAFWALKDISFDVMPGEVIGIIGKNGAGKSTLLKILTGITPPTEGEAIMHGRVSSLLEVGTGFHPELTGRENVFLNGAILGMSRKEIAQKFDEIVEFSGIGKFLDTPVKHYSSGMQVRLAFSVAAHMEPDILIVDEVLAVGDAEFQKKCMGKMEEVTTKQGRTILFVSHNMAAVQQLCKKSILIEHGKITQFDYTERVVEHYLSSLQEELSPAEMSFSADPSKKMQIRNVRLCNAEGVPASRIDIGESWKLEIDYDIHEDITGAFVGIACRNQNNAQIFVSSDVDDHPEALRKRPKGSYHATFTYAAPREMELNHGVYFLHLYLEIVNFAYDQLEMTFLVHQTNTDPDFSKNKARGVLALRKAWTTTSKP